MSAQLLVEQVHLAFAMVRRLPGVFCHAMAPGWVPTKMGGPGANDDLGQPSYPGLACGKRRPRKDEIAAWALEHREITPIYDRGAPTVTGVPGSAA
jgi:hypothetical protein